MKLIIGADLVPTESNFSSFTLGRIDDLTDVGVRNILCQADYRIFNLETPLTDTLSPIKKCGPNLVAPTNTICGMKELKVDFFTLANNHILDQGDQGLLSTLEILKEAGISSAGAGKSLGEAASPYIIMYRELKIGVYCCAEHEFSIATETSCGANPFDPLESLDHVMELKENVDYVIVLYHGGKEHYRYPSPYLQKVCHRLVEKGADLVVCQHSHCIGCEEKYLGGTIIYGQGNFLFDRSKSQFWMTGLLIEVDINLVENAIITYYPIVKNGAASRLADAAETREILDSFKMRSEEIHLKGFIDERYNEFAKLNKPSYLCALQGKRYCNFIFRAINRLSSNKLRKYLLERNYQEKELLVLRNYIECEAHRELMLEGLRHGSKA